MTTFVLVHGAWHGSWCWKRVRGSLQRRGHDVYTPTLTGVGERSHLLGREVNLETHIVDVVNLIRWEDLDDVVLCGHSYGGCVVTGAADRIADRLRALVYLDAFVLENGESTYDVLAVEQRRAQTEAANREGEGWKVPPIPAAVFEVNAADRDWVDRQCTPQPIATFEQPVVLTRRPDPALVTYILATGYAATPFQRFADRAAGYGWKLCTIASGHDVMLDRPDELTELLLAAAGS